MKAVVHKGQKGMKGLHLEEYTSQKLKANEVRVRLKVVGLNHRDLFTVAQHDENTVPLIIGSDGAGVISEIEAENGQFKVGDEVVINPGLEWANATAAAPESFGILGSPNSMNGTFAEEVILPIENIAIKPSFLTFEESGVLSLSALTAYRALFTKGEISEGKSILIPGIGGGVATFLLQFAKAAGAEVYVTSRSEEKLQQAKELGADKGIQNDANWEVELDGEKVDLVIETVGAATFQRSLKQLRPGGTLVLIGSSTGDTIEFNLREFFYGQYTLKGTTMGSAEEYQSMLEFIEKHQIHPVVDQIFEIEEFKKAFKKLENGKQVGKIGLRIS